MSNGWSFSSSRFTFDSEEDLIGVLTRDEGEEADIEDGLSEEVMTEGIANLLASWMFKVELDCCKYEVAGVEDWTIDCLHWLASPSGQGELGG